MATEKIRIITERYRVNGRPTCADCDTACPWMRERDNYCVCDYLGPKMRQDDDTPRIIPHEDCPYWADDVEVM